MNLGGQQTAHGPAHEGGEWIQPPRSVQHPACVRAVKNKKGNLSDTANTVERAPQGHGFDGTVAANGTSCSTMRSNGNSPRKSMGNTTENRNSSIGEKHTENLQSSNKILNVGQGGNLQRTSELNSNRNVYEIESDTVRLGATPDGNLTPDINDNVNRGQNSNRLGVSGAHALEPYEEEIDPNIPAWALEQPVDGYIMHPVAGLVMHPSFYDNRHLIRLATRPRYIYDGEVDGPLCSAGKRCDHIKNCFEVRVRMAVLAYQRHHISFRDAEYIWSVSRSTIQRRKAAMEKRSPIIFLLTPDNMGE